MTSKATEDLPLAAPALVDLIHFAKSDGAGGYDSRQNTIAAILGLVIDAAPGALDTLNELAAALGDDANYATTIAAQLAALQAAIDALEAGVALLVPEIIADAAYSTVAGDGYAAKRLTNAAAVAVTLTDDPPVGARIRFTFEGAGGGTFAVEGGAGLSIKSRDDAVTAAGVNAVVEAWRDSATSWTLLGDVTA